MRDSKIREKALRLRPDSEDNRATEIMFSNDS